MMEYRGNEFIEVDTRYGDRKLIADETMLNSNASFCILVMN